MLVATFGPWACKGNKKDSMTASTITNLQPDMTLLEKVFLHLYILKGDRRAWTLGFQDLGFLEGQELGFRVGA